MRKENEKIKRNLEKVWKRLEMNRRKELENTTVKFGAKPLLEPKNKKDRKKENKVSSLLKKTAKTRKGEVKRIINKEMKSKKNKKFRLLISSVYIYRVCCCFWLD